ncbi:FAD/NAD(P)-binding protein [Glarea lozoyensis ATCC 20868]|uniref:FAD/NAD(P)-binding protein n=1 Tax=Glarea lozoyensis (strain ATCC 20868 / MF5171) TaxID=1116229 RepID=S3DTX8_GLAL2|nr:FAD/NAD(P)-binding protein [Glarea lozoyensis ATCC 20868]EPE35396.1 FAD/NAD(P)-binding protein [Glarea lozoyensis ATCC 20868]
MTSNVSYAVSERPLGTPRHVRIVTIGAGASGINMIRTLREKLSDYEHVVYDKNPSVGGTWYENRYPGCRCDIPAHNYQFSWKKNPAWSTFFAKAEEIERYLCDICRESDLGTSIKTSHVVKSAIWSEEESLWHLKVENTESKELFDDFCHFLLDATGILNKWKWPDIPGLNNFKGDLLHTANWPKDFEYSGKRVAVIGNGSSGVQLVPAIQKDVKELVHFVRSPLWVTPPPQQMLFAMKSESILEDIKMEGDKYTPEQIEKFASDPEYYLKYMKIVEEQINNRFPGTIKDSDIARYTKQALTQYMKATLKGDEKLIKALVPDFAVGCRRLTPAIGYLESLSAENVRVVTDTITEVGEHTIKTSTREEIEIDVLICATGFDVSFCPRFPIIGREGNLQDLWKDALPRAYMSSSVPGFPNYFMFLGPNAPIGHGSVFTITEHVATYIANIILKCQTESILSLAPSTEALDDFYEHINAFMPRTAWASTCRSWFKNGKEDGPVTALHPGSRIHWFHMLEKFRGEDFVYTREKKNRFSYLGNGFSTKELGDGDPSWYLGTLKSTAK